MSSSRVSRSEALASAVVRRVRRLPGGKQLAGRAVRGLRRSMLARKVVSRVFDVGVARPGRTVFLGAGNLLAGEGLDNLPVVVVSLVGAADDDLARLVEGVAQEQVLTGGFRPVIVLGSSHFGEVRQYGYPVEYVVPRAAWHDPRVPWEEYLATRLTTLRRHYQARGSVELGSADASGRVRLRSYARS